MIDEILKLTKQLLILQSTQDNPDACSKALELVKNELKEFYIEEFEKGGVKSILVHNAKPGTKKFKIILHSHLDVVKAEEKQFTPLEKNGKLYGRGAYDMKATVAVMILLFKNIAKKIDFPLALQIVTDEEIGGYNGAYYQIEKGVRADFVITGECGSDLQIVNQAKGVAFLTLHTQGVNAHGAYPWRGKNALWKLHAALAKLHEIFPTPDSEIWETTATLTKIETNNITINSVPGEATAHLDVRFIPQDAKLIIKKITEAVSPNAQIKIKFLNAPVYTPSNNKYIKILKEKITQIINGETKLISAHGTSDMRHFSAIGCPGVEFGVIGGNQNADNEWVDIRSLKQYYDILEQFLLSVS